MIESRRSIELDVPAAAAYERWSRFEELPRFVAGVRRVEPLPDGRLRWVALLCGQEVEWRARVTEDAPERVLAWRSEGSDLNAGRVTFEPIDDGRTRVTFEMRYNPEAVADALGDRIVDETTDLGGDLETFKEIVEEEAGAPHPTV